MELHDLYLDHPFTMVVAGPTGSGKTSWIKKIIENAPIVSKPPPERIIYFYGEYQPLITQLKNVTFIQGISEEIISHLFGENAWIIIDDLMNESSNSLLISELFTKGSHHRNLSVILILQNFFQQGRQMRNITLNSQYIVLFKNA